MIKTEELVTLLNEVKEGADLHILRDQNAILKEIVIKHDAIESDSPYVDFAMNLQDISFVGNETFSGESVVVIAKTFAVSEGCSFALVAMADGLFWIEIYSGTLYVKNADGEVIGVTDSGIDTENDVPDALYWLSEKEIRGFCLSRITALHHIEHDARLLNQYYINYSYEINASLSFPKGGNGKPAPTYEFRFRIAELYTDLSFDKFVFTTFETSAPAEKTLNFKPDIDDDEIELDIDLDEDEELEDIDIIDDDFTDDDDDQ